MSEWYGTRIRRTRRVFKAGWDSLMPDTQELFRDIAASLVLALFMGCLFYLLWGIQ